MASSDFGLNLIGGYGV